MFLLRLPLCLVSKNMLGFMNCPAKIHLYYLVSHFVHKGNMAGGLSGEAKRPYPLGVLNFFISKVVVGLNWVMSFLALNLRSRDLSEAMLALCVLTCHLFCLSFSKSGCQPKGSVA